LGKGFDAERQRVFCQVYLRTLNPDAAAAAVGRKDGWRLLREKGIAERLEEMRAAGAAQILREDAVRRLAELAFGRANDALALALGVSGARERVETLDLSAVAEFKVTDKGGVEVKLLDRVRALEALCAALDGRISTGADDFFRALEDSAGECGA
jgi:phage terminase small subunit